MGAPHKPDESLPTDAAVVDTRCVRFMPASYVFELSVSRKARLPEASSRRLANTSTFTASDLAQRVQWINCAGLDTIIKRGMSFQMLNWESIVVALSGLVLAGLAESAKLSHSESKTEGK